MYDYDLEKGNVIINIFDDAFMVNSMPNFGKIKKISLIPVLFTVSIVFLSEELQLTIFLASALFCYLFIQKAHLGFKIRNILLIGFLLRVIVAIGDHYFHFFPYVWDDFFTTGVQIKKNILESNPVFYHTFPSVHVQFYGLFNAVVYLILDNYSILMRIVSSFWCVLAAERIFRLSQLLLESEKSALITASFITFLPSIIVFSSLNMRDSLILFLTMDMLWRFGEYYINKRYFQLLIIPLVLIILYFLRIQYLIVYMSTFIVFLLLLLYMNSGRSKKILVLFIFSFVIVSVFYLFVTSDYMQILLAYANTEIRSRASGGSVYLEGMRYSSWLDLMLFIPIRFIYFTFGPFPWQVSNIFMLIGSFEAILFLIMIIYASKGFRHNYNEKQLKYTYLIVLFIIIGLAASSMIDSNYGTAIRHRMNYMSLLFIFSANYLRTIKIRFV